MGATCASYTIQHSVHIARAEVCGGTSISNHLRKVGRHRSAFDENKRNAKLAVLNLEGDTVFLQFRLFYYQLSLIS